MRQYKFTMRGRDMAVYFQQLNAPQGLRHDPLFEADVNAKGIKGGKPIQFMAIGVACSDWLRKRGLIQSRLY